MTIERMNPQSLDSLIEVDKICFDRQNPRTINNLQLLASNDSEGCFIIEEGAKIIGYVFSKTLGEEGYIGPVGVLPEYRKYGIGKKLVDAAVLHLKNQKCSVIGLEVLPEKCDNIGFYYKLGFETVYPTLMLEVPKNLQDTQIAGISFQNLSLLGKKEQDFMVENIHKHLLSQLQGVNYSNDIKTSIHAKGDVVIALENESPVGFFSYCDSFLPYVWGSIREHQYQNDIIRKLMFELSQLHSKKDLLLGVNTMYNNATNILIESGCKIKKSINRMILNEGHHRSNFLNNNCCICFRAWFS